MSITMDQNTALTGENPLPRNVTSTMIGASRNHPSRRGFRILGTSSALRLAIRCLPARKCTMAMMEMK